MGAVVSVLMHTAYAQRDKMVLCVLCVTVLFHYFSHPLIIFHVCRIWFSTNAATDVSIALALLWQLSQIKSPFKATQRCVPLIVDDYLHLIIHTHILFSLIRRLMASTIRTGTMTSVVAVITLILFLTNKEGNGEPI